MKPALSEWHFESACATTARAARAGFADHLREFATRDSDIEAAEIIFGELIGNVLRHAPGPIQIDVDWTKERRARLRIHDTGPRFQCNPSLPSDSVQSGRGLYIVASLAHELRVSRRDSGSTVTAVLPVIAG